MTTRMTSLSSAAMAAAFAAVVGMGGALAQTAQQVNPSPMPPGSQAQQGNPGAMVPGQRANEAPGMSPTGTQSGTRIPDSGMPGGTGVLAPSAQPDVGRGTAPTVGAQDGSRTTPGMAQTAPSGMTTAPSSTTTMPPAATMAPATTMAPANTPATGATAPNRSVDGGTGAPQAGANSFTEGQARSRISDAGFTDVQDLRRDDQGVWRGRAMRNGQQTSVALDFQGNVTAGR